MIPSKPEAFRLMMEGSQAFTDMEERGMRIDVDYLERAITWTTDKISSLVDEMRLDPIYTMWRKYYGSSTDVSNRQQLADIVFNRLGYKCNNYTKTKKQKTDVESFEHIDEPFVRQWTDCEKLRRTLSTDLIGTLKQTNEDGFLHPFFYLAFTKTYRSASRDPNFQNKANRDQRLARLVRRAFIPRTEDHLLCEADYGALEFRGAACFWKDPQMIAYASDPTLDVHRDMAAECYSLDIDQVTKTARTFGKNKFVFPKLYGSSHKKMGPNLWDEIGRSNIQTKDGVCLYEHLKSKGIRDKDSFTEHIKEVEDRFAGRFPHWNKAKDKWWKEYLKHGEFQLMTGFACRGVYSYNNLMNYPIQGPSFHLLLWSLIEMNRWLKENKMRSCVIGQIHDSMYLDIHKDEIDDVLNALVRIMTVDVRKHWKWVVTPLEAEIELSAENWFEKKPWELTDGKWCAV